MKRTRNPHEVRMVAGILDDPQYDADQDPGRMAQDIVVALNERREREKLWVVGVQSAAGVVTIHGPYLTRNAAVKGRQEALIGHAEGVVAVWPLLSSLEPQGIEEEGPVFIAPFGRTA